MALVRTVGSVLFFAALIGGCDSSSSADPPQSSTPTKVSSVAAETTLGGGCELPRRVAKDEVPSFLLTPQFDMTVVVQFSTAEEVDRFDGEFLHLLSDAEARAVLNSVFLAKGDQPVRAFDLLPPTDTEEHVCELLEVVQPIIEGADVTLVET